MLFLVPMENKTKALIALIVALLCISAIYFYASSIKPVDMAPGEITLMDEGKLVRAHGVIGDPVKGDGYFSFDLVDAMTGGSVKVFLNFYLKEGIKMALVSGARAEIVGEVTNYKEKPELEVKDGSGIKITAQPEANDVRLGVLLGNRAVFDNMTVVVHGTVDKVTFSWGDANITLVDGQFKASCRVSGFSAQVPFHEGDKISIVGRAWSDDTGMLHISAKGWQAITVEA